MTYNEAYEAVIKLGFTKPKAKIDQLLKYCQQEWESYRSDELLTLLLQIQGLKSSGELGEQKLV